MVNILRAEESLRAGQRLRSVNREYELVMQADGDLVLWHRITSRSLWSTGTNGRNVAAVLRHDGSLMLYGYAGERLWSSAALIHPADRLSQSPGPHLLLDNDGQLLIHLPLRTRSPIPRVVIVALWSTPSDLRIERILREAALRWPFEE